MKRLRELDFLRGVAIFLVLMRHEYLFQFTVNMGWIGVDLFFVLSGFLVSGLLFKEYLKYGQIYPARFLIRRGFKIYPIYYIFYLPYLIPLVAENNFSWYGFFADMIFMQNYLLGWGFAYIPSWSLAVEEHFYFGLTFALWLGMKNFGHIFVHEKNTGNISGNPGFSAVKIIAGVMVLCVAARFFSVTYFPLQETRNFTMTHLRIDSLLAGVLIAYMYYFGPARLSEFYHNNKKWLAIVAIAGLSWTPFMEPIPSYFVQTMGFTLLYISFGIILIHVLHNENINNDLNKIFSKPVVNLFSKIGYCSYSIYIIHSFINYVVGYIFVKYNLYYNHYIIFILTSTASILSGMLMTYKIENYFLSIRNRYFPSRAEKVPVAV